MVGVGRAKQRGCIRLSGVVAVLGLIGCGPPGPEDASTPGALGNGLFYYSCTRPELDAACGPDGLSVDFPRMVAVTSTFRVRFEDHDERALPVHSSAPRILDGEGRFEALGPGEAGVFVRSGARIVDYVTFDLHVVDQVLLRTDSGSTVADLLLGVDERVELQGIPAVTALELAGSLEYAWSIRDPGIAELVADGRRIAVTGLAEGETVLEVTVAGVTTQVPITVFVPPPPRRTPPPATTGASEDTTSTGSSGGTSETDSDATGTGGTSGTDGSTGTGGSTTR